MNIKIPIRFEGSKCDRILYAIFDSGATYSCISETLAAELTEPEILLTTMRLSTADENTFMDVHKACRLAFYHEDIRLTDEFLVVPSISKDVIIGAMTMQKWKLKLDFDNDTVIIDPRVAKLILVSLKPVS